MHHVIARLEIESLGGESGQMRFAARRPRDEVRRLEQVFRTNTASFESGKMAPRSMPPRIK